MRKSIQSFLKYTISLAVAVLLFWYLYKDLDFAEMVARFKQVDLTWVYLSIGLSFLSHFVRAYRWNLLLEPLGYDLKSGRTFLAVMVGYLANFIVPRMGEISRCGILQKTDNVPISTGIGSVVTERIIDVLCLLVVILITLSLEFDMLSEFFLSLISQKTEGLSPNNTIWFVLLFIMIVIGATYFLIKRNSAKLKQNALFNKVANFLRQLVEGVLSIRKLKKGPQFIASTIFMWILYYLMTYVVIFSLEETARLSITAGFTMLVLGGIGMATPVQGGIGAFHYLMSAGLLLYGIPENDGIFFALLLHTTNSVAIMVLGLISFFISMVIPKRKSGEIYANAH
ncbi:lysylphosphatidylglycerol synthase transmembrane domain-containing protein [Marivirga atlantica]|uniref:Flippase-like domain-containing protein n=1 Tax=Marivirga atlantica TaxID=1548457 RepID=A0A937AHX8_9BACT|nr:lysylphosphatidylglycerol synthase transmembrane domain-containing protein [Marivirga atlantica]MBL0763918.1 flippase-like domain-containing protein [Marivirga atlantica]